MKVSYDSKEGVLKIIPESKEEEKLIELLNQKEVSRMNTFNGWDGKELHVVFRKDDGWHRG
jgi:hypothetical protein